MALATYSGLPSYNVTANSVPLDLSDELAEIIRKDNTALLQKLRLGSPITETTFYWVEDSLNANTATLNEALDASETDVDVLNSTEYARFKIGTIFKFNEKGKSEVLRVTALPGSPTLTVERGHGSTSGETHASGATIMIIAHTRQEGQNMTEDDSKERTVVSNYPQIFQLGVNISYTRQFINYAGIASEFAHQVSYRLQELMRSLDSSIINSVKSATAGSSTDYRSMGGLIEFASQAGGNTSTTVEDITTTVVNDSAKLIWDDGGVPNMIVVGGVQKRKISLFDQAFRRSSYDTKNAGYVVDNILTDLGYDIMVAVDPWVPDDIFVMGDSNRMEYKHLQYDQVRVEPLARQGRSMLSQVTGQYSLKVENATQAFSYHSNLNS